MDPYIGEVRIFAGSYAPEGWLFCQGQVLQIMQYQPLFAVIHNVYGGDGRNTFALPDLRGRVPISQGQGPGLPMYSLGVAGGDAAVQLTIDEMPYHNHDAMCSTTAATSSSPDAGVWAKSPGENLYADNPFDKPLNANAIMPNGGGVPHNNQQPCLDIGFIIATEGIFPSQG